MHGVKHRYLDTRPETGTIDRAHDRRGRVADRKLRDLEIAHPPGLRYSSPWPWVLALGISLSMWAGLAWLVRLFV